MTERNQMGQVKAVLAQTGLFPKKSLGQHFLVDKRVVDVMIRSVSPEPTDIIIEIGPGLGALTEALAETSGIVAAVELDDDLVKYLTGSLESYTNLRVIHKDFLKLDWAGLAAELSTELRNRGVSNPVIKVVGSLPYYITSEIIISLLAGTVKPVSITLLIQKEVAAKLIAKPKTTGYGILTLTASYHAQTEILAQTSPEAFYPTPTVDSSVVRLTPFSTLETTTEKTFLFAVIKAAFASRRKTILNNLTAAGIVGLTKSGVEAVIKEAGIATTARGEELGIADFDRLCHVISHMTKSLNNL